MISWRRSSSFCLSVSALLTVPEALRFASLLAELDELLDIPDEDEETSTAFASCLNFDSSLFISLLSVASIGFFSGEAVKFLFSLNAP